MKIGEYEQMMAYLRKPNRLFTSKPQNTIGGGVIKGEDLGTRQGFNRPTKYKVDDKDLITEWRNSLKTAEDPVPWGTFLRNKFGEEAADSIRARVRLNKNLDLKPEEEFKTIKKSKVDTRLDTITKLVKEHNDSDRLLYTANDIFDKLGVTNINRKEAPEMYEILDTLDKPEDKVKKAFDKIITEDLEIQAPNLRDSKQLKDSNVIFQMIADIVSPKGKEISKKYAVQSRFIKNVLNTHEPYLNIKDDFDYFARNAKTYIGKNFNEAFELAKFRRGGLDIKNLKEFYSSYAKPDENIYNFAIRHAYLNHKKNTPSKIQFFKINKKGEKVGKPLNFDDLPRNPTTLAREMNTDQYGFEYENKFFTKKNLKAGEGIKSGLFDEVYALTNKGATLVPDPNNPGKEITLRKLLQDTGDKLTIGHDDAAGGISGEPFKNLKLEGGKFNIAMFNAYNSVKDPGARAAIIDVLQDKFKSLEGEKYEEAFIKSKSQLAKDMFTSPEAVLELPTYYKGAAQQVLFEQGKDFFNQPESFQKEIARVADIKLEDYAANRNKFRQFLFNEFCGIGGARQRNALGGRIGFAEGPQVCSADTVARGMQKSIQAGDSAKVLKALNVGKNLLGYVVAPADIAIETAFALPHLLEGDLEGAKQATTPGLFGWGKDLQEQVGNRFGTNSPAYGSLEKQRAIDLQVEGMFEMDKALEYGAKADVFKKDEEGNYTKNPNLTVSQIDSFKNANNLFKSGAEKTLEAKNLFIDAAPKILGPQNESTALSQLGVFSDELRSGTLDQKIGDPGIVSNLFKSLNISQPAERTVEGYLSTAGGLTEYPLASKVKQSELIQENLNRLKELRIADFPLDIAAQIPAYEKAQMPSDEETELRLRQNLGMADPQLVEQYQQMGFPQLTPFLPAYANGGRIHFSNGGRLSFAEGPEDPSKRKTLKKIGVGGGIAGGLMTGLINIMDLFKGGAKTGVAATKAAESEAQKIFFDLVEAVKNKGIMNKLDDVFETKVGVEYEYKGVKVLEDGENIEVRFETDKGAPAVVEYRKPGYEVDPDAQTSYKVPGEFIGEGQQIGRYGKDGDVDLDFEEEIIDSIDEVKKIAKGVKW